MGSENDRKTSRTVIEESCSRIVHRKDLHIQSMETVQKVDCYGEAERLSDKLTPTVEGRGQEKPVPREGSSDLYN